jgi:hypothetical protein
VATHEGAALVTGIASASASAILSIASAAASVTGAAVAVAAGLGGFSFLAMSPEDGEENVAHVGVDVEFDAAVSIDIALVNLQVNGISATVANGLLSEDPVSGGVHRMRVSSIARWWEKAYDVIPVTLTYDSVDKFTRSFTTGEQADLSVEAAGAMVVHTIFSSQSAAAAGSWVVTYVDIAGYADGSFIVVVPQYTSADGRYWVAQAMFFDNPGGGIVAIPIVQDNPGSGLPHGYVRQDNLGSGLVQGYFIADQPGSGLPSIEEYGDFIGAGIVAIPIVQDNPGSGIPSATDMNTRIEISLIDSGADDVLRAHGITFLPMADVLAGASVIGAATVTATGTVV